jgi:hypothetical protein
VIRVIGIQILTAPDDQYVVLGMVPKGKRLGHIRSEAVTALVIDASEAAFFKKPKPLRP